MRDRYKDFLETCKQLLKAIEDTKPHMVPSSDRHFNYPEHIRMKNINEPTKSWTYGPTEGNEEEVTKMVSLFGIPMRSSYQGVQIYADRHDGITKEVCVAPFRSGQCHACGSGVGTLACAATYRFSPEDFKRVIEANP